MSRVYLAGQITGLTYDGAEDWREQAREMLAGHGITAFSPLRGKSFLRDMGVIEDSQEARTISSAKGLTARDREDVRRADAVLMYLPDDARISIGTMIEVGWADAWRVPVVLVITPGSLYATHPMVRECVAYTAHTLAEGVSLTVALLLP